MSEQKVPLPEPDAQGLGHRWHTPKLIQSYGDARELAGWNAAIEWSAKNEALIDACVRETERAIRQRDEFLKTGVSTAHHGGSHDTCFGHIIAAALQEGRK